MRIRRGDRSGRRRRRLNALACALACALSLAARAQDAPEDPEARLKRGTSFFEYGDCNAAVDALAPLAQPGQLKDERGQIEVHRMLGVCLYQLGRIADASRELSSLLYIDPEYTLDPFLTPPPVVELFEAQKAGIKQRLDEIKKARENAEQKEPEAGYLIERTTVVREQPFATVFLPFGLAQAANGETVKAIAVGSVLGGLLAVNVGAYWWTEAMSKPGVGEKLVANEGAVVVFDTLRYVGGAALVLAAGTYLYSVVDAWWFREDLKVVEDKEERRALTPEEMKQLRRLQE